MTINNNGLIFIQIAAYRDPELKRTIEDMISNAAFPDNLRIAVCWQHTPDDAWDDFGTIYKDDAKFRIIDVPAHQSKGACWARNQIQQEYNGEQYTLQLDSHHRFIRGWDWHLISMYKQLKEEGYPKPLITAYLPAYNPGNDPGGRTQEIWQMNFDKFSPEGVVLFLPAVIPHGVKIDKPIPARFYSAHFAFTTGKFCEEVQHDPKYYFHGEEISIAVRAFTHGYDLFHPNKLIAWHEYTRKGRTKQWDDDQLWYIKDRDCQLRNRVLLGMNAPDEHTYIPPRYNLGNCRSLSDYEQYAGIRFADRSIKEMILNQMPPSHYDLFIPRVEWESDLKAV